MNHKKLAGALVALGESLVAAEDAELPETRLKALEAMRADIATAAEAVLEHSSFSGRDRVQVCSVGGCDEATASHFDQGAGEPVLRRVFLCQSHEVEWRAGVPLELDTAKVPLFLVKPEGATAYDELAEKLKAVNGMLQEANERNAQLRIRIENVEAYQEGLAEAPA